MNQIDLFSAIAEMRRLTAQGIAFSFEHHTWDMARRKSTGLRRVDKALLRPAAKADDLAHADHKLFYEDFADNATQKNRVCWQILITKFNGQTVTVKQPIYENI